MRNPTIRKPELLKRLSDFDIPTRHKALEEAARRFDTSSVKPLCNVNMHIHSFFSYNVENWSPSRIAYECALAGLHAAGIIDFDVIDGKDEFIQAGELLGLRTSVGIETRAFLNEFANRDIDSPGEPGVSYIAAAGFAAELPEGSPERQQLDRFRETARIRNLALIERINPHVDPIAIDYQNDVLPLTPSGNATERHIVQAYLNKSLAVFTDAPKLLNFWSQLLETDASTIESYLDDRPTLENAIRNRFAKRGGFGYVQPDANTFPPVESFFTWVKRCKAIPMESWLDGTSPGESDPQALLELSLAKGAEALNIIPDRNWNIKDADIKQRKVANLDAIIHTARALDLPLHIGTEMNKQGLPFVDDLEGEVLKQYRDDFIQGANVFTGHTVLKRFADFAYTGEKAAAAYSSKADKNRFFARVGALPPVSKAIADSLRNIGAEKAFNVINDSVTKCKWTVT